ncbi:amidohydrolase family protein [Flavobacteriaceae bacterium]|jgi:L-fuconolactonase|nr:amidohydrolase family protein [Flavobacteriaceae bacterium]MDA8644108.1 amidohydrolase family protein [Flavobacteriaceae bacterium]MDC0386196.1 amidohydrolase family protein [Flavobacteriaceae bacterium]MDC0872107.1 amidohydrolase family protein [Flavobacteriaceae bacterium]
MIIDSHQHFWKYNPVRDAWIDETMGVLKRNFLPEDLAPILKENEVSGCIAIQADQSENETEFLLLCAAVNPFIKGVVGWVDLCASNLEERLAHFSKNPLFKGVRHIVQAEKEDYLLREEVQRGIGKLLKYNLTFDLLVYPHQLPAAVTLANQFPEQKFVLDHLAKPFFSEPLSKHWLTQIARLSENQNVFCKLSGMVTETKEYQFNAEDFTPFMDVVFEHFGPDRVMFGSDWPVCLLAAEYQKVLGIVLHYINSYSQSEKDKILAKNAISFYNLKTA